MSKVALPILFFGWLLLAADGARKRQETISRILIEGTPRAKKDALAAIVVEEDADIIPAVAHVLRLNKNDAELRRAGLRALMKLANGDRARVAAHLFEMADPDEQSFDFVDAYWAVHRSGIPTLERQLRFQSLETLSDGLNFRRVMKLLSHAPVSHFHSVFRLFNLGMASAVWSADVEAFRLLDEEVYWERLRSTILPATQWIAFAKAEKNGIRSLSALRSSELDVFVDHLIELLTDRYQTLPRDIYTSIAEFAGNYLEGADERWRAALFFRLQRVQGFEVNQIAIWNRALLIARGRTVPESDPWVSAGLSSFWFVESAATRLERRIQDHEKLALEIVSRLPAIRAFDSITFELTVKKILELAKPKMRRVLMQKISDLHPELLPAVRDIASCSAWFSQLSLER